MLTDANLLHRTPLQTLTRKNSLLSCATLLGLCSLIGGAASAQTKTAATTPATQQPADFKVSISMPYCDRSLPYSLVEPPKTAAPNTPATLTVFLQSTAWENWLTGEVTQNAPSNLTFAWQAGAGALSSARPWDPFLVKGVLNDEGDPLLGNTKFAFEDNPFLAERLLTRTLLHPDPLGLACSTDYLENKPPSPGQTIIDAETYLHNGLASKTNPAMAFNLADPANARNFSNYYLIDIVRWQDNPTTTSSKAPGPQEYQVASDDWYLFNYSNRADHDHDLISLLGRYTPQTVAAAVQALNMAGDQQLTFLGIHLAPTPAATASQPTSLGLGITPTELAWYNSAKIEYSFHATKVQPVNIQDAQALWNILKTYLPAPPGTPGESQSLSEQVEIAPSPSPAPPDYSSNQGLYGAAFVTDLQVLPADLVGTWTATFTNPKVVDVPGVNQAYPVLAKKTSTSAAGAPSSLSTCDTTLDPANPVQKPCSNTGPKVHDEKLAWWDISLLVPIQGYSDLTFQVSTPPTATSAGTPNVVSAKTVTRTNAYAMFDLMPGEQDLNNPPALSFPYLAAGLPLAGKVLDKPYFAVAETISIPNSIGKISWLSGVSKYLPFSLNPAFGWVDNKEFRTAVNSATNAVTQSAYRAFKPQFSIGISFRALPASVKTALGKSSTSSAKNSATVTTGSTH